VQVSAFFNPGILLAQAVRGKVEAGDFFALLAAELAGYFAGGVELQVGLTVQGGRRMHVASPRSECTTIYLHRIAGIDSALLQLMPAKRCSYHRSPAAQHAKLDATSTTNIMLHCWAAAPAVSAVQEPSCCTCSTCPTSTRWSSCRRRMRWTACFETRLPSSEWVHSMPGWHCEVVHPQGVAAPSNTLCIGWGLPSCRAAVRP